MFISPLSFIDDADAKDLPIDLAFAIARSHGALTISEVLSIARVEEITADQLEIVGRLIDKSRLLHKCHAVYLLLEQDPLAYLDYLEGATPAELLAARRNER